MVDYRGHPLVFQRPSRKWRQENSAEGSESGALLLHRRLNPYNEFCYKESPVIRFSPDGRLAFLFSESYMLLHVVDLLRNTRIVFKANDASGMGVCDFAVVNPTTVIANQPQSVWLFRLDVESATFETIELEALRDAGLSYVFTEIRGTGVELNRAVLNQRWGTELRFVRLNVDAARLEVDAVVEVEGAHDYRLSADGRRLYGLSIHYQELNALDVYDIEQKKWSTRKLAGDVGQREDCSFAWANDRVFLSGYDEVEGGRPHLPFGLKAEPCTSRCRGGYSVFGLNLREGEWTKLPIVADHVRRISAIVDESGEASGLLVMNEDESDTSNWRMEVYRLLFRTPDSLVRIAVDALRRHNLDVAGKEGFHELMNGACKGVLPSLYAGMTPIPRL
ncbi:hypothetical protein M3Y99_01520300 [Aphelenchoides fujianensis]|nr:hypothetical protein M3Y99_01520300 [Aphelenchoides fujianensis]